MKNQYHILNGDSLKEQFPHSITGEIIVVRECLVEGSVAGKEVEDLYTSRALYLSQNYGGTQKDYYDKVVTEFNKIIAINKGSEINLWFEDDLFCQVNFWFIVSLLTQNNIDKSLFLIRPQTHNQYGFGGLHPSELIYIFKHKLALTAVDQIANLWSYYQNNAFEKLISTAQNLAPTYPFILAAVKAHIDRQPTKESEGKPTETLLKIMSDLGTEEFGPIFQEFSKRAAIYGYGDLQVKKLLDKIKEQRS